MVADTYCIDASSLIKLKQDYRRNVFPGVWEKIEELAKEGRLIAPDEVRKEIERDDVLDPWSKKNKTMFRKIDQEQANAAKEVITQFPNLAKHGKFGPAADPFVVVLARLEDKRASSSLVRQQSKCVVVTEERGANKIPGACVRYNLTCVSLVDLFDREGWKF